MVSGGFAGLVIDRILGFDYSDLAFPIANIRGNLDLTRFFDDAKESWLHCDD